MALNRDEEEAVFRNKLLYDGHGSGQDKRLMSLMKNVTKLCLTDEVNNSILKDIQTAKTAADQHNHISQMYDRTFKNLEEEISKKQTEMEKLKEDYVALQSNLEFVEKLRKVDAYPSCQDIEQAMRDLEKRKRKLLDKLEKQKDSSQTLAEACKSLQKILDIEN